jgi:hypothetical protein
VSQQRGAAGTEEGEDDDDSDSDDSDSDDSESGDSMDEDEEEAEQSVGAAAAPADDVELDEEEESDIELDDQSDAAAGSVFSPAPTAASGTAPKVRWTALPHISSHAPFTLRLARNTTDSPRSSFPRSLARSLARYVLRVGDGICFLTCLLRILAKPQSWFHRPRRSPRSLSKANPRLALAAALALLPASHPRRQKQSNKL